MTDCWSRSERLLKVRSWSGTLTPGEPVKERRQNTRSFNRFLENSRHVPSIRAAVGISLALICDAQSPWRRMEEHFLLKSSRLSRIFLWSSSCKTLTWHTQKTFFLIKKNTPSIWRIKSNWQGSPKYFIFIFLWVILVSGVFWRVIWGFPVTFRDRSSPLVTLKLGFRSGEGFNPGRWE